MPGIPSGQDNNPDKPRNQTTTRDQGVRLDNPWFIELIAEDGINT